MSKISIFLANSTLLPPSPSIQIGHNLTINESVATFHIKKIATISKIQLLYYIIILVYDIYILAEVVHLNRKSG